MAVTQPAPVAQHPFRPGAGTFARLKLRVLANGLRGKTRRIVMFIVGVLLGLYFAAMGFLVMTLSGAGDLTDAAVLVPVYSGAALVLGWFFVPLVWTGVDESLDPAKFALLPLPRRTLVIGLLVAALLGIPAAATLLATMGLVVGAANRGGAAAALAQVVGILLGLLLCVTVSRASTSAFASLLRARRTRDAAAVALALLAASLGPLQLGVLSVVSKSGVDEMTRVARVLGWTPLSAPYLLGFDVAEGRYGAALARAAITVAAILVLLWWWSRTIESAMLGVASGGAARQRRGVAGGPVAQLYPRLLGWLPRNQYGVLAAREARYWWRDPRRRASLITVAVVGVFVPVMVNLGLTGFGESPNATLSPTMATISIMFVGALAAVSFANQFGFDGTAYALHVVIGVPGRVEMRARTVGLSVYMVPLLAIIATVFVLVVGDAGLLGAMLGAVFASYGTGVAVNLIISVLGAYSLPETSNPFAINTGAGVAKSLFAFLSLIGGLLLAAPVALAATMLPAQLSWLVLLIGVGYGYGAGALGTYIAGDLLDRRAPELLGTVSPNR